MSLKTYGIEVKRGDLAEAAAREAGLGFKVAGWTGDQISFHDMPDFYRNVDAVVASSISEAANLPVMEAAAAGRLVISTPVGHFPLKAYQGGGIIAPVEAEKFKSFTAATLRYYKDNPAAYVDKCRSIQEAARKFDWQYSIGEWIELIETARLGTERSFKLDDPKIASEEKRNRVVESGSGTSVFTAYEDNKNHGISGEDSSKMNALSTVVGARIFTTSNSVLYVDGTSGELRHGPIQVSPANVHFVPETGQSDCRRGWLIRDRAETRERIVCQKARSGCASGEPRSEGAATPTLLELVPLERGLMAFRAEVCS